MRTISVSEPRASSTFCPAPSRRYVLIAAILASALGFIDGSVLAVAMPTLRSDLGANLAQAQWISNAYALTLSALILVGGAAGDRFGLRKTFIAGIALFVVASLACALAPGAATLIGFRAVQGIGAAIMVPCSLAIIAKAYPKAERGKAIGIWAAASALTTALGPVIGGFALSAFDEGVWRAIFVVNVPLGAVAIYLLAVRVPADQPAERRGLDIGGAALAALGFGALAFGLTAMSSEGGASSFVPPAASLGLGVLTIGLFLWWETRHKDAMVDLALFRLRPFSGANIATFFLYFSLSAITFYLPMLLISGWGLSAAEVGFTFVPLSIGIGVLSGPVGKLSDRIGPWIPIAGGSIVVGLAFAGVALLTGAGLHAFWSGVFPLMVMMGLGMALVVSPLSSAVMTAVEDKDTGAASGINNAVARVAGLVAVAAMGALAAVVYSASSGTQIGLPEFGEAAQRALSREAEAVRIAASDAAFAAVAGCSALFCALAALAAWFSRPPQEK